MTLPGLSKIYPITLLTPGEVLKNTYYRAYIMNQVVEPNINQVVKLNKNQVLLLTNVIYNLKAKSPGQDFAGATKC